MISGFTTRRRAPLRQRGLTLVEVLVSLVIGVVVIGGVMTLLANSRSPFQTSENRTKMLDNARYAIHTIGRDLRHSGSFGLLSWPQLIFGQASMGAAIGDCATAFYIDVDRKVYGTNETNPFVGTCIPSADYKAGTDILVVRYAEPTAVTDADTLLAANRVYVQSKETRGDIFLGGTAVPTTNPDNNFPFVTNVYYINQNTEPGDGIPSLHRISLVPGTTGAEMEDELLVSGAENLQVQYGLNDCIAPPCVETISRYVDADNTVFGGTNWPNTDVAQQIQSVRVWLLVRSATVEPGLVTTGTFAMGSKTVDVSVNDSILRMVYSGVFYLRNRGQQGSVVGS